MHSRSRLGFRRLVASVRLGNGGILGLIRSTDRRVTLGECDGGVLDAVIELGDGPPAAIAA